MRREALTALDGLISEEVGLRLAELAAQVPATLSIVELGSYKGKSSCYLAEGAREGNGAHVWCVEAWDSPGNVTGRFKYAAPATREAFTLQVKSVGLEDQITPLQGFTYDVVRRWRRSIGLLYIDASHRYPDVKADYEAWSPFVVPDGVLVFDDYSDVNRGVKALVDELRRHSPQWQGWTFGPWPLASARRVV